MPLFFLLCLSDSLPYVPFSSLVRDSLRRRVDPSFCDVHRSITESTISTGQTGALRVSYRSGEAVQRRVSSLSPRRARR